MACSNHDCLLRVSIEEHRGMGTNATCKCVQEAVRGGDWILLERTVRQWRAMALDYRAEWKRCSEMFNERFAAREASDE